MNSGALKTDLYQLTMAAGYFAHGMHQRRVTFELFVRRLPAHRRYLVLAGLESALSYLRELRFSESQIAYLAETPALRRAMTFELKEYLRAFRFRGDVHAMPEGSVFFANEPVLRVTGTLLEAQLVETFLLSTINTETTVATKAARVVQAAGEAKALEFGSRRTSPEEAALSARAAYLAGFDATSNVEAGYRWDIPIAGTAAHSWTMSHESEEEAFAHYAAVFGPQTTLLVDTYDTLIGTRRAIAAAKNNLKAVRLDSGDLLELSREVRKILDEGGCSATRIVASGDLDEHQIAELRRANAPIDVYGVGTELVRPKDDPTLGGVYKLVYDHTAERPIAKLSTGKATLPGVHQVYRVRRDGKSVGDVIGTVGEFHVDAEPLLIEWMKDGALTRPLPSLAELRETCRRGLESLAEPLLAIDGVAESYPVTLSDALEDLVTEVRHRELKE
jgi:nicotinate phosphoribosyltransferase